MRGSPYTDLARPPLRVAALSRALITPDGLWQRLDLRARTGSTNADAVAAARDGEPEGLVVVAEQQTAGRGRLGRNWVSPPRAGLAVSVLLRPAAAVPARGWPAVDPQRYGWLPLLTGVALVEAVARLAELEARLKWPNDLLLGDGKAGGILAESVPGDPPAVVVGIGLNVTSRLGELPEPVAGGARPTSLAIEGAAATDRDPLLRALLRALATRYADWRAAGGDAAACGLAEAYRNSCASLGRPVRAMLPGGTDVTGEATAIDGDGRLIIDGTPIAAGDITHLR